MPITTTSFTSVNVGTSANDGTGDELRIAFQKVNSNFSNISTVGFNSGNILVSGNVQAVYFVGDGSQLTNIAPSNAYGNANVAAYLVAYNGIVSASNVFVSGNVTSQWFLGKANLSSIITTDLGASGMIYANAGVNSTSTGTGALVVNGGVGITGNLVVGNLTVLGTQTTVSATSVAVANSFVFLSNNNITNVLDIGFVGQYAAGQGNVYTGLVRRASDGVFRLFGNLSPIPSTTINVAGLTLATLQLGNILAGNVTGVINVAAQPYITSLGNLANLSSSGNITTTGYFFGNGSQLAGVVSYSNVFVATYLPTYSGNVANLTVTATLAGPTITAINSNVSVGNTNMKNYVDGQITAANSAVTSANLGLKGYVDNSVSTANIAMKGYVDAVADRSIYGNSNVKSYLTQFDGNLISNGNIAYSIGTNVNQWASVYANVIYANSNIYIGGTDIKSYIDSVASLSIYSNVNTKAYTESMGFQNYGNVNVAAYVTSMGVTNYSNVNVIAYLAGNVTVGNISATYFTGNGSQLTGLPSGYSNVQVATYLPTYSGNIANVRLGVSGVLTFSDGTAMTTASAGGGSNYSNANVTAYTVTMGFTNFSNVNVAALITTNGLTNYSNVNTAAYLASQSITSYSNVQVATYLPTYSGNIAANIAKAGYIWSFGSDGNLTLPRQLFLPNGAAVKDTPGDAVGLGNGAGYNTQGDQAVAIGREAGETTQGARAVAVGIRAGQNSQGISAVAIGDTAGNISQGNYATAVGINAGRSTQGLNATAVGNGAGETSQGLDAIAVGVAAGNDSQGARSVAIGVEAGQTAQGNTAIAIGYKAGKTNQSANSIAINSSLSMLYANVSGLFINPVRQDDSNIANVVYYNTTSKEMTYGPAGYSNVNLIANLRGSITVGNITILGALNTTLNIGNSFIGLATDNTSNTNDIGFYGQYNVGQGNVFTGLAYTATDGMYRLFSNVTPEPSTTINQANIRYSNIQVGGLNATGNILATGLSVFGNTRIGSLATPGALHTIIGNVDITGAGTEYFNIGGNILAVNATLGNLTMNGNVDATGAWILAGSINSRGNVSVGGNTALAGNLTVGTVGAATGAFHTVVGNITQTSSGGAVYINTTGNILANVATFGSGNVGGFAIGYRDVPQITAANVTLIASDAGKHYYATNTSPTTLTIPLNSSVAFAIGTAVSVVNQGTGNITIAKGSTTLYLAGNSTSANRTITSYGMATLIKVATDTWFINGTGVS